MPRHGGTIRQPTQHTLQSSPEGIQPTSWWDSNIGRLVMVAIIPVVISIVLFQFQYSITTQYQQKEAANKFLSEIEILEPNINQANSYYVSAREAIESGSTGISLTVNPIYPDTGLYFTNSGDLGKFDHSLTKNLTQFYFDILGAESARKQVIEQSYILSQNSTATDEERNMANQTRTDGYLEIIRLTDKAAIKIPELKKELQIVSDKKPFFNLL